MRTSVLPSWLVCVCVWGGGGNISMTVKHKIYLRLFSRYYVEACNEWRDPSPRLNTWTTQIRRNIAAVTSRWRHCIRFDRPRNQTADMIGWLDRKAQLRSLRWLHFHLQKTTFEINCGFFTIKLSVCNSRNFILVFLIANIWQWLNEFKTYFVA